MKKIAAMENKKRTIEKKHWQDITREIWRQKKVETEKRLKEKKQMKIKDLKLARKNSVEKIRSKAREYKAFMEKHSDDIENASNLAYSNKEMLQKIEKKAEIQAMRKEAEKAAKEDKAKQEELRMKIDEAVNNAKYEVGDLKKRTAALVNMENKRYAKLMEKYTKLYNKQ